MSLIIIIIIIIIIMILLLDASFYCCGIYAKIVTYKAHKTTDRCALQVIR